MKDKMKCERKKLAQMPWLIGGSQALAEVPTDYNGPCEVKTQQGDFLGVLPSVSEARSVACYAITPDGGYASVVMVPAPGALPTHQTIEDWISMGI